MDLLLLLLLSFTFCTPIVCLSVCRYFLILLTQYMIIALLLVMDLHQVTKLKCHDTHTHTQKNTKI